jgi:hypothetical protein
LIAFLQFCNRGRFLHVQGSVIPDAVLTVKHAGKK